MLLFYGGHQDRFLHNRKLRKNIKLLQLSLIAEIMEGKIDWLLKRMDCFELDILQSG